MQNLISLQRTNIKPADYLQTIEEEYKIIKPFLPKKLNKVLDIGCGLGGIDVFLYRDFKPEITFLDRDGIDSNIRYGFAKEPYKYNFLSTTKNFVETLGVSNAIYINIDQTPFPSQEYDLTISLLAMGYHFPLETYHPKTKLLIVDIRNGQTIPSNSKLILIGENYKRVLIEYN